MTNKAKVELVYVPIAYKEKPPKVLFDEETIVRTNNFKDKETNAALKRGQFVLGPWKIPFGFNYIRLTLNLDKLPEPITFMRPVYEGIPDSGVVIIHPGAKMNVDVSIEL